MIKSSTKKKSAGNRRKLGKTARKSVVLLRGKTPASRNRALSWTGSRSLAAERWQSLKKSWEIWWRA
jgi:hypothetical protein